MLVLNLKVGQAVVLEMPGGEKVSVVVVRQIDNRVSLGFDAPRSIGIWRRELLARKHRMEANQ